MCQLVNHMTIVQQLQAAPPKTGPLNIQIHYAFSKLTCYFEIGVAREGSILFFTYYNMENNNRRAVYMGSSSYISQPS